MVSASTTVWGRETVTDERGRRSLRHGARLVARVTAPPRVAEVLVSRTVTDLVAGSGLRSVDRGIHPPKGVSGDWLFAVRERDADAGGKR